MRRLRLLLQKNSSQCAACVAAAALFVFVLSLTDGLDLSPGFF
jgi:hypothetical protein